MKTVCADPALIGNRQAEVARAIAPLLQMSEADLGQRLTSRVRQNEKGEAVTNQNKYVRLKRKVPLETWQKIQAAMTNLTFGLDEKKLPKDRTGILPRPAPEGDFSARGRSDARLSERRAGGARARFCAAVEERECQRHTGFGNRRAKTALN